MKHIKKGWAPHKKHLCFLTTLFQPADNLASLEDRFTTQEIDVIVRSLPSNQSPGPNGFNTDFVKNAGQQLLEIFTTYATDFTM